MAASIVLAIAALALVGGCSARSETPVAQDPAPLPAPMPAEPSEPLPLSQLALELVPLWRGFSAPLYLTNAGDGSGRLFVVEQGGKIRVIRNGKLTPEVFLDVSRLVTAGGERGLLGLAFAPDYAQTGNIYIDYTDRSGDTVVARYTTKDPASDTPEWGTPLTVLTVKQPYANHNGGCLQFGPDGALYVGMGDGGSGGDPQGHAQRATDLLGKILRVDVSGDSFKPEVWAIGLRNPWRFSFDTSTGALWIGDVGQGAWEEIDYVAKPVAGLNFGWNRWEGTHPYPENAKATTKSGFVFPVAEYPHPTGESVTGGYVYRGQNYPALAGAYLYADYVKGWIAGIRVTAADGTSLSKPETMTLLESDTLPASFGEDESGELYMVDHNGTIYAITAAAK